MQAPTSVAEPHPSGRGQRYRSVVDLVLGLIAEGHLNPGDRAPSLRELSARLSVSVATAMRAYAELERLGHLEARPQSGHYVSRQALRNLPPPRAPRLSARAGAVKRSELIESILSAMADPAIVPLGAAVPAHELLPARDLARLAKRVMGDPGAHSLGYGLPQGEPELRRQIAYHLLDSGAKVPADDLIITVGATEAASIALSVLARPGDAVVVESPCYFGFLLLLEDLGLQAIEVPTDPQEGPDPDALARAARRPGVKACILQPNFGNPHGGLYPLDLRKSIYEAVVGAGVPLIEDDLYGDLTFGDKRPPSLMAEDREGMVIHLGAFSKILAPGFRVGWLRGGRFHARMLRRKLASTLATARGPQAILAQYLAEGRHRRHIRALRAHCRTQVATYAAHILRAFPPETRVGMPQGGFVLWVELPERVNALDLYHAAMRRGIGLAPGPMFSSQDRFAHFVRLNCGYPWNERMRSAVETLGELARERA